MVWVELSDRMYWLEIVVCSPRDGKDKRLHRLLEYRASRKKDREGCVNAWVGTAVDESGVTLACAIFEDEDAWSRVSEAVNAASDKRDGGLEAILTGPPLIGVFQIPSDGVTHHEVG